VGNPSRLVSQFQRGLLRHRSGKGNLGVRIGIVGGSKSRNASLLDGLLELAGACRLGLLGR
jgi:hypothetical protein